jgi:predicted ATPase
MDDIVTKLRAQTILYRTEDNSFVSAHRNMDGEEAAQEIEKLRKAFAEAILLVEERWHSWPKDEIVAALRELSR